MNLVIKNLFVDQRAKEGDSGIIGLFSERGLRSFHEKQ